MCLELSHLHFAVSLHLCSQLPRQSLALKTSRSHLQKHFFKLAVDSGAGASGLKSQFHLLLTWVRYLTSLCLISSSQNMTSSNHLAPTIAVQITFNSGAYFSTMPGVNVSDHATFSFLHLSPLLSPDFLPLACKHPHLSLSLSYCPFLS